MFENFVHPPEAAADRSIGIRIMAAALVVGMLAFIPYAFFAAALSLLFFDSPGSTSDPATIAAVTAIFLVTGLLIPALIAYLWALFRPKRSLLWWGVGLAAPAALMHLWLWGSLTVS
ncbi:hypothetical protein ACFQRC_04025 [Enterovirga sp. GCM10030262]|uniref:hypothetical protein n=1 Tax=Enterovirga sp. GCM10030262 TaxID=3273391 RepID=UPI00361AAA46